jgi:hypothetical protein
MRVSFKKINNKQPYLLKLKKQADGSNIFLPEDHSESKFSQFAA